MDKVEVDKLCKLSREGWILAPNETKEALFRREKIFLQASLPKEQNLGSSLYDFQFKECLVLYSNESLRPWQGAVLWEYETKEGDKYPVLQLKKKFSKGDFGFYRKEEVLSHELVHAVRFAFKEPFFEEILAYQTSSNFFRRFFGPLFMYPMEATLLAICSLISPLLSLFLDSFFGIWVIGFFMSFLLIRLLALQSIFFLACKNVVKAGVNPLFSLAVLLRLSDLEITKLAFKSPSKTKDEWNVKSTQDLRFKVIMASYFE